MLGIYLSKFIIDQNVFDKNKNSTRINDGKDFYNQINHMKQWI